MRWSPALPARRLRAAFAHLSLAVFASTLAGAWTTLEAQVSIPGFNVSVNENFNTLASAGTSSVVPLGWVFLESGTNADATYTAGSGSSNAGDTYSFGATADHDRAFGGLMSGNLVPLVGAQFQNDTGQPLRGFTISYFGEQWRLGTSGRADRLDFQISYDATSLTTGTWTDVNTLDFVAPVTTGAVGALNGNNPANRRQVKAEVCNPVATGGTFWIRWLDFNASGADDGLAVDDFTLNAQAIETEIALSGPTDVSCSDKIVLTATVTQTLGGGVGAGHTVEFHDGPTLVATGLTDGNGIVVASLTGLSVGSHSLTANFLGSCSRAPAGPSNKLGVEVTGTPTAVQLTAPASSTCGDKVVLHAEVTPSSAIGSVEFFDGVTSFGVVPLDANGIAEFSATGLAVGAHSFSASYSGDACGSSSDPVGHAVMALPTSIVLYAPPAATCGDKIVLTADMRTAAYICAQACEATYLACILNSGGDADLIAQCEAERTLCLAACPPGALPPPSGNVEFFDGATSLGIAALVDGVAELSVTGLLPGTHSLTATYPGQGCDGPSTSNKVNHDVTALPTTTVLTAPSTSICGEKIVLQAQVTSVTGQTCAGVCEASYQSCLAGAAGDPDLTAVCEATRASCLSACPIATLSAGGSVEFFDGGSSLGVMPVDGTGMAELSVTGLAAGPHSLTAVYSGGDCKNGSVSNKVVHLASPQPSGTTLASDSNPAKVGSKINLTAAVTPAGTEGSVEFFDGATSLGTAPVDPSGAATLSVSGLGVGSHLLTAVFSGTGCYAASTSDALKQSIVPDNAPVVTVSEPHADDVMFIGADAKIAWTAVDDNAVTSVTLCLSRDNGLTYEDIVVGIPNTGTYVWTVTGPATNTGADPEFTATVKVKATDTGGNVGTGDSGLFAIYDLATDVLLSLFQAEPVPEGIELRWKFGATVFTSVALERAEAESGPWSAVVVELRDESGVTVATDRGAQGGRTYYYRLVASSPGATMRTFGPLAQMAGQAITEFAIASVAPNPSPGLTRLEYTVPRESSIRLSIVDLQGREVSLLANGSVRPGRYQAVWNGRTEGGDAPGGIYFVRYRTPVRSLTRRLVLVR